MKAGHILLATVLVMGLAACNSSGGAAPPDNAALAGAVPTPTNLAAAVDNPTVKPNITPKPSTPAKVDSGAFYKPPGWDGSSDVDCKDFDTHAHAQSFFIGTGGSTTNDPYGLDGDHDSKACETLP